jgi:uncharacterized protein
MRKKVWKLVIRAGPLLLLPLLSVMNVRAASFDCAKTTTKVEKMICADAELSNLDEELATAYTTALQIEQKMSYIQQAQKQWLKGRNSCVDFACVKQAYSVRLQELESSTGTHTPLDNRGTVAQQGFVIAEKPLYGHCVDVQDPRNCGRFQSGKGYTVCEKYLEHLNSLSKMPKCEVPVPPSFQRPDWEEVDVMQHLDWAYQAETIRFSKSSWYTHPDFATWQKEFLAEKEAGKIAPAMRKVRVKPLGEGKEVTILAYTRHREGCQDVVRQISKGTYWSNIGYAHFLLPEASGSSSVEKMEENGRVLEQTEMLLYAGKPYFVREFSSGIANTPGIMIYSIASWPMHIANEPEYLSKDFCNFEPYNWNKPNKSH